MPSTTLYKNADFIKENVDNKCDNFILCNVHMIKMSRVNGSKESKYFIKNTVLFYEAKRNDLLFCAIHLIVAYLFVDLLKFISSLFFLYYWPRRE